MERNDFQRSQLSVTIYTLSFFAFFPCLGTPTFKREHSKKLPYKMILVLGFLSIVMLTIIFYLSNIVLTAVLFLYLIYLILQFYPYSMANTFYEVMLRPFFKVLILSSVSFFAGKLYSVTASIRSTSMILFHIFCLIQVQIKNTTYSNQPNSYYQELLLEHSNFLRMTTFLLPYAAEYSPDS